MVNLCKKCSNNIGNQCFAHGEPEPLPLGSCFSCQCFKYEVRKVGRWNPGTGEPITVICSLCGCEIRKSDHQYPYCPDCGAEMIFEVF